MKVKTLTLEGETGYTAKITRDNPTEGLECIMCEIVDQTGKRVSVHHVSKNDKEDSGVLPNVSNIIWTDAQGHIQ